MYRDELLAITGGESERNLFAVEFDEILSETFLNYIYAQIKGGSKQQATRSYFSCSI